MARLARILVREAPFRLCSVMGRIIHGGAGVVHHRSIMRRVTADILAIPTFSTSRIDRNCCSCSLPPDRLPLTFRLVPTPSVRMSGSFWGLKCVTLSWTQLEFSRVLSPSPWLAIAQLCVLPTVVNDELPQPY